MNKENCALKLVDEIILYYDARSKKRQIFIKKLQSLNCAFCFLGTSDHRCMADELRGVEASCCEPAAVLSRCLARGIEETGMARSVGSCNRARPDYKGGALPPRHLAQFLDVKRAFQPAGIDSIPNRAHTYTNKDPLMYCSHTTVLITHRCILIDYCNFSKLK